MAADLPVGAGDGERHAPLAAGCEPGCGFPGPGLAAAVAPGPLRRGSGVLRLVGASGRRWGGGGGGVGIVGHRSAVVDGDDRHDRGDGSEGHCETDSDEHALADQLPSQP